MRRRVLTIAGALAACWALGGADAAVASNLPPAVVDCNAHSKLTQRYSASELQVALAVMPRDIAEYTDCYNVIQQQLLAQTSSQKLTDASGAGSGGSFLPTPVLIAIIVLALGAAALGVVALRRRQPPQDG